MKKDRHSLILKLIEQNNISTQDELLEKLLESGINVTQATVSRDIKELKLIKRPSSNGVYKYCIAENLPADEANSKYYSIFIQSVVFVDCAGNMCVLKCHIGTAMAACAALDSLNFDNIVGTLAGDDTIFVLCRTETDALNAKEKMEKLLKL
ncbi:MAG: arginine repressor [Clostridia bacterium]|nr:arginine repressor [Clostridia bacterium]